MEERKRFQNQTLDSEAYEKTEKIAKVLNKGVKVFGGALVFVVGGVVKKYAPELIQSIEKIRKT